MTSVPGRLPPLRLRVWFPLAAATLPFALVFLFAELWVYAPLRAEIQAISLDIEHRYEGVGKLQLALTRSAMPVNDYLIHGRSEERGQYELLSAQVEAAFSTLSSDTPFLKKSDSQLLLSLRDRWQQVRQRGEQILQLDERGRRSIFAADAMERFDQDLDLIADASDKLLEQVRADLKEARAQAELRGTRLNWFVLLAAGLATIVSLSSVLYIGQTLRASAHERADDEPLPHEV